MILLCNPLLNSPIGVCGILGRRRWVFQFLRINQYHPPFSLIGGLDYCFAADHVSHPHYCCRTVQEVDAQIHARRKWSGACGSQGSWKIASSVPAPSWSWNVAASQAVVLVLRFHPGLTFGCDKEPRAGTRSGLSKWDVASTRRLPAGRRRGVPGDGETPFGLRLPKQRTDQRTSPHNVASDYRFTGSLCRFCDQCKLAPITKSDAP